MSRLDTEIERLVHGLAAGNVIPYLGAGVLELGPKTVLRNQVALAGFLAAKTSVPFKLRTNLTAAAQYVENFKHRKTLTKLMSEAFANPTNPTSLHYLVAERRCCPLIVDVWYDSAIQRALAGRRDWGQVQGVSHAEHPGRWYRWLRADGSVAADEEAANGIRCCTSRWARSRLKETSSYRIPILSRF